MARVLPAHLLPTQDGRIDIEWIDFNAVTPASRPMCCKEGSPAAKVGIQDDIVALS